MIHKKKLLIVDNDDSNLDSFSVSLKSTGLYEVETASDSDSAINKFRNVFENKNRFDIVLLDLNMGNGMNGVEILAEFKKIDCSVSAIAISGDDTDPVMLCPEKYGFKNTIAKPISPGNLAALLGVMVR